MFRSFGGVHRAAEGVCPLLHAHLFDRSLRQNLRATTLLLPSTLYQTWVSLHTHTHTPRKNTQPNMCPTVSIFFDCKAPFSKAFKRSGMILCWQFLVAMYSEALTLAILYWGNRCANIICSPGIVRCALGNHGHHGLQRFLGSKKWGLCIGGSFACAAWSGNLRRYLFVRGWFYSGIRGGSSGGGGGGRVRCWRLKGGCRFRNRTSSGDRASRNNGRRRCESG